ncbi:hypothetical protein HYS95_00440 [Candidatus Daviesbacteria bacterium]|nr:hypothetical protein [Candidatus Daviesbacteria bacterium]
MSEIVFNPQGDQQSPEDLKSQIENLQTTLASLNQQVIILQEALQERDQQIAKLKENTSEVGFDSSEVKRDETVTIVGALINLYNYIFLPGKAA